MTRITLTALATIALAAAPAAAVTWDTNDDGSVNAEEFVSGYTNASAFDRFDDNDDDRLTPAEVGLADGPDAVFRAADDNKDGVLSRSEVAGTTFDRYDENRDRMLDATEMERYEADEEAMRTPLDDITEPGPKVSQ